MTRVSSLKRFPLYRRSAELCLSSLPTTGYKEEGQKNKNMLKSLRLTQGYLKEQEVMYKPLKKICI